MFVLNSNKFDKHIYIKNSPVQGVDCPNGICNAIKYFNKLDDKPDLIMITRGGGGIDDLMGFSHPNVIEEIYKSRIFTMSAVGHEVDNMLSDFVSDIRAPTPSIGAEIICKNYINHNDYVIKLKEKCSEKLIYSKQLISNRLNLLKRNFCSIKKKMYLNQYESNNNKIKSLDRTFTDLINKKFNIIKNDIELVKSNISILKHNEYNVILLKNNVCIKNIDEISNGIYDVKINGKIKKIKINVI